MVGYFIDGQNSFLTSSTATSSASKCC